MAGDVDSRKSTSGYLITFASGAVSWQSKLQKCVGCSFYYWGRVYCGDWSLQRVALDEGIPTGIGVEAREICSLLWQSECYSSIDSAGDSSNERASSVAKSTRLITAFSFLSPASLARHLPSGSRCSKASCIGGQELRLAGYFLYLAYSLGVEKPSLLSVILSQAQKKRDLSFFAWKSLFVLILFASVGPTQQRPYARSSPIVLRLIPSYRAKSLFRPFLG